MTRVSVSRDELYPYYWIGRPHGYSNEIVRDIPVDLYLRVRKAEKAVEEVQQELSDIYEEIAKPLGEQRRTESERYMRDLERAWESEE